MSKRLGRLYAAGVAIAAMLTAGGAAAATAQAKPCDPIDPAACLLPYPNDWFAKGSKSSPTRLRLDLPATGTPAKTTGKHIGVRELNRLDGWSPGSMLITHVPGLDAAAFTESGFPTIVKPSASLGTGSPVLLLDWKTGRRVPVIAELDAQPTDDQVRDLLIRPLVGLREGRRYLVVLRGMTDGEGNLLDTSQAFTRIRSGKPSGTVERARAADLRPVFSRAKRFGVARNSIQLTWDFTVASRNALTGRMLSIRNRAFAGLGDRTMADGKIQGRSPNYRITAVDDFTEGENANLIRRIRGEIDVPCFLDSTGCAPGGRFVIGSNGLPKATAGINRVPFVCNIPRSLVTEAGVQTGPSTIYGHGLLGDREAIVNNGDYAQAAFDFKRIFCAMDWQGMSSSDLGVIGGQILPDLSNFPMVADRVQQGILNMLFMGRALLHKSGLRRAAAFQFPGPGGGGSSVLGPRLTYSGDSQGGIIGGALVAVAPDLTRGSLGVPGMNYSTLLDRSTQFSSYGSIMYANYEKNSPERPLLLALIQQLWDRAEMSGYASSFNPTNAPLAKTQRKRVLLLEAFGDFQVTNLATETEARTIAAKLRTPALDTNRFGPYEELFWRIASAGSNPIDKGNAMLVMDAGPPRCWDSGVAAPPITNTAPIPGWGPGQYGGDPHGIGGGSPLIRELVAEWLDTGVLTAPDDLTEDPPFYIGTWNGPGSLAC